MIRQRQPITSYSRWLAMAVIASTVVGCAPSMQSLLHERHYAEALCAGQHAADFDDNHEYDDSAKRRVTAAIVKDMAPSFHMHAVTRDELVRMLGPDVGTKVADAYLLVRVLVDTNKVPLQSFRLTSAFVPADEEGLPSLSYQRMAELTGETPPSPRTVDPSKLDEAVHGVSTALHAGHAVTAVILDIPTLGIFSKMFPPGQAPRAPGPRTLRPSAKDHACQAPYAAALDEAITSDDDCAPGRRCTRWLVLPRGSGRGEITAISFDFYFEGPSVLNSCSGVYAVMVPIGGRGDLRSRIAAMFSDRRLRTLPSDTNKSHEVSRSR